MLKKQNKKTGLETEYVLSCFQQICFIIDLDNLHKEG